MIAMNAITHYFIFNRQQMSELADASKQEQGVQVSYSIYRIYRITIPPVGRCCLSLNSLQHSSVYFKVNAVQFHPGLIVRYLQYILQMRSIHVFYQLERLYWPRTKLKCNNYASSGRWDNVLTVYVFCEKSGGRGLGWWWSWKIGHPAILDTWIISGNDWYFHATFS